MLQILRDKTQGLVAWGIIALIVVVFSLWGVNNYSSSNSANGTIAAKVDGKKITWPQIDKLVERQRQYLAEANPTILNQIDANTLRMEARQYLIQQLALDSQTKRLGFVISERQVAKRISTDPVFLENGKFSALKYKDFLHKIAESEASFTDNLRAGMQLDQLRHSFLQASFVPERDVNTIMDLFFQQRDFGYLVVPANKFGQSVVVKQEDVEQYFNQHQHMFVAPEQVKLAYVELSLEQLAQAVEVSEEKLQEYYQKHAALYTVPEEIEASHILINAPTNSDLLKSGEAKAKADDIYAKIKLGEDFHALAKKYSDDTISGSNGGGLGRIGRGQTVDAFDKAAFALANPGDLSEVVQSEYGYHIIKLQKRHPAYVQPFAKVRNQLVANYKREVAESMFPEKGEELANLAFEFPDSLSKAAEKMQLQIQETALFGKSQNLEGIAAIPEVAKVAFSEEMLTKSRNSDLIKVDDEHYVVVRVVEHVASRSLALNEVQDKITNTLRQNSLQKQAAEFGDKLLAQLKAGDKPYAIAKAVDLEWHVAKDVERSDAKLDPMLVARAFALPKPASKQPVTVGFALSNGDYAVLSLRRVKASAKAKEQQIQQQFQKQLAQAFAQKEFQLFELALIKNASISVPK